MSEEEVIEKIKHIDRYKDSGDTYTREDVEAIGRILSMYEYEKNKRISIENDIDYLKNELGNLLSRISWENLIQNVSKIKNVGLKVGESW